MSRLMKSGLQYCLLNLKSYYHGAAQAAERRSEDQPEESRRRQGQGPGPGQSQGQSVYLDPRDDPARAHGHAAAPPVASQPEECSQYVLKVVTDRSQSVCKAK
jgi:hypothetical protein